MTKFWKGHGTANDFVLLSDPEGRTPLTAERVKSLSDRRRGIGADGVIRAVRVGFAGDPVLDGSAAEWAMDYWNADGSTAQMCGNGLRVFVRFLIERELITLPDGASVTVSTRAGDRAVVLQGDLFSADLGQAVLGGERLVSASGLDVARPSLDVSTGNPHTVVALATVAELEGLDLTREPRLEPEPVDGANVEFVVPGVISAGRGSIRMRVHERGSGETLSCGTGAVAAAAACRSWVGGVADRWDISVPGGSLEVRFDEHGHAWLTGPAVIVFSGEEAVTDPVR